MKNVYWLSNILIIGILAFTIYGTYPLVQKEWVQGDICPKIAGIPACYIVLICFTIALLFHILKGKKTNLLYFVAIGINTLFATTGTVGELTGLTECPRTAGGTPMCFISLGICLTLLLLKIINIKYSSETSN